MVIGRSFIWLHYPKCAGTFTEYLLRKYFENDENIVFDEIDPLKVIWHQNVSERERMLGIDLTGKDIICNFRRLPYWIISRVRYEELRSGIQIPREMLVRGKFYEFDKNISHADRYISMYNERKVKHWIRQENIIEDFNLAFADHLNLSLIDIREFDTIINSSGNLLSIKNWFSPKELVQLYESCPKWAAHEQKIYGNLLTL
jgi:hypothetical protein